MKALAAVLLLAALVGCAGSPDKEEAALMVMRGWPQPLVVVDEIYNLDHGALSPSTWVVRDSLGTHHLVGDRVAHWLVAFKNGRPFTPPAGGCP